MRATIRPLKQMGISGLDSLRLTVFSFPFTQPGNQRPGPARCVLWPANYFWLYLHAAAISLLVGLRRIIAVSLPAPIPKVETATTSTQSGEAAHWPEAPCRTAEGLTGVERQGHFHQERRKASSVREKP
jgi:hypothetical protein